MPQRPLPTTTSLRATVDYKPYPGLPKAHLPSEATGVLITSTIWMATNYCARVAGAYPHYCTTNYCTCVPGARLHYCTTNYCTRDSDAHLHYCKYAMLPSMAPAAEVGKPPAF